MCNFGFQIVKTYWVPSDYCDSCHARTHERTIKNNLIGKQFDNSDLTIQLINFIIN